MRAYLAVAAVVLLGAVVSTFWFMVIWGQEALFYPESSMMVRFAGTVLAHFTSVYSPFGLPVGFGSLFGPVSMVMGFAFWPLVGFLLWRWDKMKNNLYFIGFAVVFLAASFHWMYYNQGISGI